MPRRNADLSPQEVRKLEGAWLGPSRGDGPRSCGMNPALHGRRQLAEAPRVPAPEKQCWPSTRSVLRSGDTTNNEETASFTMKTRCSVLSLWASLGLAVAASAQPPDIRQGLVAYWPMEFTDGTTTPDASPFGNHLTLINMSAGNFVGGRFGNAVTLNGSSTYLIKTHGAEDYLPTGLPIYRAGSYTIAFWVNGAPQTAKYLFTEGNNSGTNQSVLLILQTGQAAGNNAKFDVIIRNDAGGTGGTPVNHVVSSNVVFDSTWHHVTWVDDQGRARLYVDGNPDPANFNYTPVSAFTFNTTTIGA